MGFFRPQLGCQADPSPCSGKSGPPGKVPLRNVLHYYPHPPHLGLSRGQISLEPKQCEQSNAHSHSRTKFRECLPHCCTEQFHFLRSLTCWPLFPHCVCLPPLAAQLAACWSVRVSLHRQTPSGPPPSTGDTRRDRWRGRAEGYCRYEGFRAESPPHPLPQLLCSTPDLCLWLQDSEEGRR